MNNIRDLHFQQQILPLFDHVINELSRERLIALLTELPGSVEQVYSRQRMLKVLLQYPALFNPFSYARIELSEAYEATINNKHRGELLLGNRLSFYSPFAPIKNQQQEAKVLLVMSFFKRINNAYFACLDVDAFPDFFKAPLKNIIQLFSDLRVEEYNLTGTKSGLSTRQLISTMLIIDEKVRTGAMENFWNALFLFEAYLSIAKGIRKYDLQFPTFTSDRLKVSNFYHPLVKGAVKNSIDVTSTVNLLTGPNMSGKSTLLRALGLCVYLAHLGLAVPATICELKFYEVISIAIDLHDDVQSGYSHFMTELNTLKDVVLSAEQGKNCFAVFDELFRGTNSDDALAISLTTINGLTRFPDSCFFISTHIHALKDELEKERSISLQHIDCQLSGATPVFTYQLKEGWSDVKIGQILFDQAGLGKLLAPGS